MDAAVRSCQSCKTDFRIDPEDFDFYQKMKVPPPTWCPECRMIRRFVWRNERHLFRRKDSQSGQDIFSGFPGEVTAKIYSLDYWNSDDWDPMEYGRDYDFSRPFFEQFKEFLYDVPWPAKSEIRMKDSEYSNQAADFKNAYLCFTGERVEDSAYIVGGWDVKDSLDLYESRQSQLCYDSYMVDDANKIFFSVNCEESADIWFSNYLVGCTNCFGCVNLRNKSYYIFNKPYSREDYLAFLKQYNFGSYATIQELRAQAQVFWMKFPKRFTLGFKNFNSTGEHVEESKNVIQGYCIHGGEDLKYCQFLVPTATDSYDHTNWGNGSSQMYESITCGEEAAMLKFCWECWPSSRALDYSAQCRSSSDLFGCVSLKKKQYCIFNKQYSKEDYFALREKIIAHMNEMPYTDHRGNVYRYGEFFPSEFSPHAYNEILAQDFFPLTKESAESKGYLWREPEGKAFETTLKAMELPDNIDDAKDEITKEVIQCQSCQKPYRIIPMELNFYRHLHLPLPHLCPNCRFAERFKFVNPPKFWPGKCQCIGAADERGIYANGAPHFHGDTPCPNEFQTSYAPGRSEIIYCEQCYQAEVA